MGLKELFLASSTIISPRMGLLKAYSQLKAPEVRYYGRKKKLRPN
jgi:hypothetical protein